MVAATRKDVTMKPWTYKQALITGASSGLGEEFALQIAALGTDVILLARREGRLEALAQRIRATGRKAEVVCADLEQPEVWTRLAELMRERGVDLLVNNAGYGKTGLFAQIELKETLGQIDLNVRALTALTYHAASGFMARGVKGGIINVASVAATQPLPNMAVYAATKAYVRSFSRALGQELRGSGVQLTTVLPGAVATEFFSRAGESLLLVMAMKAGPVVRAALHGFHKGKAELVPGLHNQLLVFLTALLPDTLNLWASDFIARKRD
jgi:short-subunit dehydrogenase